MSSFQERSERMIVNIQWNCIIDDRWTDKSSGHSVDALLLDIKDLNFERGAIISHDFRARISPVSFAIATDDALFHQD